MTILNKVIIVEGKSDKKRVKQVIDEPIEIICTHGTMGIDKIDEIFRIANNVTVLRDGKFISNRSINETSEQILIQDMVGRKVDQKENSHDKKEPSN